jgi:hypothetical protein
MEGRQPVRTQRQESPSHNGLGWPDKAGAGPKFPWRIDTHGVQCSGTQGNFKDADYWQDLGTPSLFG